MTSPIYIGVDCGTSGIRAVAIDDCANVLVQSTFLMSEFGADFRDPKIWNRAFISAVKSVLQNINRDHVCAICVDGTSGTMLPIDNAGKPLSHGRMYNDATHNTAIFEQIAKYATLESGAHGATSGLAKALVLQLEFPRSKIVHQCDWLTGLLCGVFSSDANNALKTGYDPINGTWPDWVSDAGMNVDLLPIVLEPGTPVAEILPNIADDLDLPKSVQVIAGTTDSCASFIATGACKTGDGVSVLGTTLAIKLLCDKPIFDQQSGVYSHRIFDQWLVGGASNSGGNVLLAHFNIAEIENLSRQMDTTIQSNLDYYPLVSPGERFPISDPDLQPRMTPVPTDRVEFLKAILEGIATIEANGYAKLGQLGAPKVKSLRSIGGGAKNLAWTRIRSRHLNLTMKKPAHTQAAFGAAILARTGAAI